MPITVINRKKLFCLTYFQKKSFLQHSENFHTKKDQSREDIFEFISTVEFFKSSDKDRIEDGIYKECSQQ